MKQYWVKTFFKWICSYFYSLQQWQKSITFTTHTMGCIIAQCRRRHFQWINPCIHHQLHSMSVRMQLVKMDRKKSFHTLMTEQLFHEILPHKKCHNCSSLQPGPCHVSIPSGNRNLSSPTPTPPLPRNQFSLQWNYPGEKQKKRAIISAGNGTRML